MAISKPGEFITAKCGRCNDVTGHVVMLVLDGEISKVECKACGSIHKYRDVKIKKDVGRSVSSVRRVRAGQGRDQAIDTARPLTLKGERSSAAQKKLSAKLESAWQEAMVRHGADIPVPYSMEAKFEPGAFVDHGVFGRGEVLKIIQPNKVEILFQDGVKLLRCSI